MYHGKYHKTLVEADVGCGTWDCSYIKYNPLASVPVPEICVPVLCSRAQKVAVIVIKRKCRLIPDLPAPVAQLFVPGGSVDIMTNVKVLMKIFHLAIITISTISKLWDIYLLL